METRVCRLCKVERSRVFKVAYKGIKVYTDEVGKTWRGFVCGHCYSVGLKQLKVSTKNTKYCRTCDRKLPQSRYFHCSECDLSGQYDGTCMGVSATL